MASLGEAEWDPSSSWVANANIAEYLVPVCADAQELEAIFVQAKTPS